MLGTYGVETRELAEALRKRTSPKSFLVRVLCLKPAVSATVDSGAIPLWLASLLDEFGHMSQFDLFGGMGTDYDGINQPTRVPILCLCLFEYGM